MSTITVGAHLSEPFARNAIGLIAAGMGPSLICHIGPSFESPIDKSNERDQLSVEDKNLAERCDALWARWVAGEEFQNGVLQYEFNLAEDEAPKGVVVRVTRFHENLVTDRLGMWRFVVAVQFDVNHTGSFSDPDFLVGKDF